MCVGSFQTPSYNRLFTADEMRHHMKSLKHDQIEMERFYFDIS